MNKAELTTALVELGVPVRSEWTVPDGAATNYPSQLASEGPVRDEAGGAHRQVQRAGSDNSGKPTGTSHEADPKGEAVGTSSRRLAIATLR